MGRRRGGAGEKKSVLVAKVVDADALDSGGKGRSFGEGKGREERGAGGEGRTVAKALEEVWGMGDDGVGCVEAERERGGEVGEQRDAGPARANGG